MKATRRCARVPSQPPLHMSRSQDWLCVGAAVRAPSSIVITMMPAAPPSLQTKPGPVDIEVVGHLRVLLKGRVEGDAAAAKAAAKGRSIVQGKGFPAHRVDPAARARVCGRVRRRKGRGWARRSGAAARAGEWVCCARRSGSGWEKPSGAAKVRWCTTQPSPHKSSSSPRFVLCRCNWTCREARRTSVSSSGRLSRGPCAPRPGTWSSHQCKYLCPRYPHRYTQSRTGGKWTRRLSLLLSWASRKARAWVRGPTWAARWEQWARASGAWWARERRQTTLGRWSR